MTRRTRKVRILLLRRIASGAGLALLGCTVGGGLLAGCQPTSGGLKIVPPDFSPRTRTVNTEPLKLDATAVPPMFEQALPIDLPAVVRVAMADNLDIQMAQRNVEMAEGDYESTLGGVFPALAPGASFRRVDGRSQNTDGNLFNVGFNTFQPSIAVQWAFNPGQVVYEIIAAKKQIQAAEKQRDAVTLEMLRTACVQYYELILAQAGIAAADQAVREAEELHRINQLRSQTGVGVAADELRSDARLSERLQDRAVAIQSFYTASIDLARTLQIEDPRLTLIPSVSRLGAVNLVRADAPIEDLLACAVAFRPDLAQMRDAVKIAESKRGATWWGGFGPQFDLSYRLSGITAHANNIDRAQGIPSNLIVNPLSAGGAFVANPLANGLVREGIRRGSLRVDHNRDVTFKFGQRTNLDVNIAARWSLSIFGDLKSADAATRRAALRAQQTLLEVQTQVVRSVKAGATQRELIRMAKRQTAAAAEALRLTQANLQAGTMTTLDVLAAQDAVAQARYRYAQAVVRYNQTQVNLLAALGLLNEQTLALADTPDTLDTPDSPVSTSQPPLPRTPAVSSHPQPSQATRSADPQPMEPVGG